MFTIISHIQVNLCQESALIGGFCDSVALKLQSELLCLAYCRRSQSLFGWFWRWKESWCENGVVDWLVGKSRNFEDGC
jgi:hypothetical protein